MNVLFSHYAVIDKEGFGRTFMLAREMAVAGHAVTLTTTLPGGAFSFPWRYERRDGVDIYAFPDFVPSSFRRTGFGILSVLLKILFVTFKQFQVVHGDNGHRPSSGWPCKWHRWLHRSKYVAEWWDFFGKGGQYDELSRFKKATKGKYDLVTEVSDKRKADHVVTLSAEMRQRAVQLGISPENVTVINGGCDTRTIRYYPTCAARGRFSLSPSALIFAFIGMNEGELLDLIPFLHAMVKIRTDLDVCWFTTGRFLNEELKNEFNIGNELREFGWVDYGDYAALLSCADVFLLTQEDNLCNRTRWPNKVGDYLAGGRVILTNPVGDVTSLSKELPDSVQLCEFNETSILNKIRELYEHKETLLELGKKNRSAAEEEYSWKAKGRQLESIYQQLISPR